MTDDNEEGQPGSAAVRLRALAHPLRQKLLSLLGSADSVTATRCAEVLGESVASCWYHLGILAKYGYIEPVPGRSGREKPWRAAGTGPLVFSPDGLDAEGIRALDALAETFLEQQFEHTKMQLRQVALEPPEWAQAGGMSAGPMHVTAAELHAIKEELNAILLRYQDRAGDPGRRPAAARPARIFFSAFVEPPL